MFPKRSSSKLTSRNGYAPNLMPRIGDPNVSETAAWDNILRFVRAAMKIAEAEKLKEIGIKKEKG
jgi:hypothetical protein